HFGLFSQELPLSRDSVFQALESGMPIICSMRPGDFTTTGHFILLVGTEDGKIQVRDPNSTKRSEQLWDYETLEYQINNLWAVSQ
ncbi:MAG: C39 family peptidase, partial [Blautia producta]